MHRGELFITEGGRTSHYSDLDLKANLTFLNWGQPQQKIKIDISSLGITTSQGRVELEARLTSVAGTTQIELPESEAGRPDRGLLKGGGLPAPL